MFLGKNHIFGCFFNAAEEDWPGKPDPTIKKKRLWKKSFLSKLAIFQSSIFNLTASLCLIISLYYWLVVWNRHQHRKHGGLEHFLCSIIDGIIQIILPVFKMVKTANQIIFPVFMLIKYPSTFPPVLTLKTGPFFPGESMLHLFSKCGQHPAKIQGIIQVCDISSHEFATFPTSCSRQTHHLCCTQLLLRCHI